jgi:hypothetical protein
MITSITFVEEGKGSMACDIGPVLPKQLLLEAAGDVVKQKTGEAVANRETSPPTP